ncbi:hypothetical protein TELCIR_15988, partial [Teladorsagia circumcincta]
LIPEEAILIYFVRALELALGILFQHWHHPRTMEQNRRRGRPRLYVNESERLRMRRQRETLQERAVRLETESARQHQRRENENVEDRDVRLRENAERSRHRRQLETPEERNSRLHDNANRQQQRRDSESVDQ